MRLKLLAAIDESLVLQAAVSLALVALVAFFALAIVPLLAD